MTTCEFDSKFFCQGTKFRTFKLSYKLQNTGAPNIFARVGSQIPQISIPKINAIKHTVNDWS